MKKIIFISFLLGLLFSGCDFDIFNNKKVEELRKKEAKLQAQLAQEQAQSSAHIQKEQIASKESVEKKKLEIQAELEKTRLQTQAEVEKTKLKTQAELEKQRLIAKQKKELELIRQQTLLEETKARNEMIRYIFAIGALVLIILAFFLYYYLKRKREDKLIAYNDNLKKYFLHKENQMKMELAQKILDTVKEDGLSKEDKLQLISVVSSSQVQEVIEIAEEDIEVLEHKK